MSRGVVKFGILRWSPLILLLIACAVSLTAWAFVVPIFESPDEPDHWKNAQYVHSYSKLPPYNSEYVEGNQAPLYYILVSPWAAPSAIPAVVARVVNGGLTTSCPPHIFENCPGDLKKYEPIRHVRLATAALSLIGVLFTALAAFEVTQSMACSLIAAALVGFLPQFDFRGATVNNDAAATVFSAAATYFIVRMAVRGFELLPAVFCAVAVAFAFLSKINAIAVVPAFLICLFLTAPDWKTRFQRAWLPAVSGLIALPWLIRNENVYGDFLASHVMLKTVANLVYKRSLRSPYFVTGFPQVISRSFIGYFGWMNVMLPEPIYKAYAVLGVLSLVGIFFVFFRQRRSRFAILLLATIPIVSIAVAIDFNLTFSQPQGRLLFPSLAAVMTLVAVGVGAFRPARKYIAIALLLGCLSVNVYALADVIYPAYWQHGSVPSQPDAAVPDTLMRGQPPGPLLAGHRFTQSFTAEHDGLSAVEMEVAGYPKAMKHGSFRLSLSEGQNGPVLAEREWPASAMPACCMYARLAFAPLAHSAGKTYVLSLSTEGIVPPDYITVFLSAADVYLYGKFSIDATATKQDTSFRAFYTPSDAYCSVCSDSGNSS